MRIESDQQLGSWQLCAAFIQIVPYLFIFQRRTAKPSDVQLTARFSYSLWNHKSLGLESKMRKKDRG